MQTNNKLREALAKILGIADHVQMRFAIPELANREISELKQIAEAALAEPIRNYEVGTVEEQNDRHHKFCDVTRNGMSGYHCSDAPFCVQCFAKWAQMPYKEGGAK